VPGKYSDEFLNLSQLRIGPYTFSMKTLLLALFAATIAIPLVSAEPKQEKQNRQSGKLLANWKRPVPVMRPAHAGLFPSRRGPPAVAVKCSSSKREITET
jgi:hypothetical protein